MDTLAYTILHTLKEIKRKWPRRKNASIKSARRFDGNPAPDPRRRLRSSGFNDLSASARSDTPGNGRARERSIPLLLDSHPGEGFHLDPEPGLQHLVQELAPRRRYVMSDTHNTDSGATHRGVGFIALLDGLPVKSTLPIIHFASNQELTRHPHVPRRHCRRCGSPRG